MPEKVQYYKNIYNLHSEVSPKSHIADLLLVRQ